MWACTKFEYDNAFEVAEHFGEPSISLGLLEQRWCCVCFIFESCSELFIRAYRERERRETQYSHIMSVRMNFSVFVFVETQKTADCEICTSYDYIKSYMPYIDNVMKIFGQFRNTTAPFLRRNTTADMNRPWIYVVDIRHRTRIYLLVSWLYVNLKSLMIGIQFITFGNKSAKNTSNERPSLTNSISPIKNSDCIDNADWVILLHDDYWLSSLCRQIIFVASAIFARSIPFDFSDSVCIQFMYALDYNVRILYTYAMASHIMLYFLHVQKLIGNLVCFDFIFYFILALHETCVLCFHPKSGRHLTRKYFQ